jgi:type III secretory pathway component EscU
VLFFMTFFPFEIMYSFSDMFEMKVKKSLFFNLKSNCKILVCLIFFRGFLITTYLKVDGFERLPFCEATCICMYTYSNTWLLTERR